MTNLSDKTIRSFCNKCQQDTKHIVVGNHSCRHHDGEGQFPRIIDVEWLLLECCGCESIKAQATENSPDFKTPREIHYPAKQLRRIPIWTGELSSDCQEIIHEVYKAMYADCMALSAMGTRTLLDVMLKELLNDIGGFERKLGRAVTEGIFTSAQKETIYAAVDTGNAASHRGFTPTEKQLTDVLDIVEHTLMQ